MTELHARLRAEIDRLLMAAHGADDGRGTWYQAEDLDRGMTYASRRFIELFSPGAVIAWLEGELEVLERHAQTWHPGVFRRCPWCRMNHPCPELKSLAGRLGVNVDDQ